MDTNTYNCINIDTYTNIYPILVAGRVLALTHLAAKDSFEDARLVVVIVVTLCVIVRANTGSGITTTTKIGCNLFPGRDTDGSVCTIISHIYLSRGTCIISMSRWRDAGAPTSTLTAGREGAGRGTARCDACAAPCMRHSVDEVGWPG